MNFEKRKIFFNLDGLEYSFYYACNSNTTFYDLLEFLIFLIPSLNLCQCYQFQANKDKKKSDEQCFTISETSKVEQYADYLNVLRLKKSKHNCNHAYRAYLIHSKKAIINHYQKSIGNLKESKDKEIESLKNEINNLKNEINNLKNEINSQKNEIDSLKKENNSLKNERNIQKNQINSLKKENNSLKNERNIQKNQIEELKSKVTFSQPKDTIPIDFYDAIVHINSIKDINKGWEIEMSEKGKQNYLKYKNENIIKIGVIGNANKGKSFILSKISKMESLPSGYSIKTEGLSIKYPNLETHKHRKIALLDSAGLETPVLVKEQENEKNNDEKKEEKKDKEKKYEDKNDLFKEKCREKLITELFLQNYIIHNSDVLIVIVDCLSFSEQKLIMKVKKEIERAKRNKPLYIIHNLKTYTTKIQVDNYIDNTLLKSATFDLKTDGIIITDENVEKEVPDVRFSFYEIQKDKKSPDIFHLIYANQDSEAGKIYNPLTLKFIENIYQNITNLENYDVIDTIKDRFIDISKEIIEKKENDENITKESFDNSQSNLIRLKNEKEIILKKCLIDEVGFSNLKPNGFEPKYNLYKKKEKDEEKLIIRVEIPGNYVIDLEITPLGEYNIIRLFGEKKKDIEPEKIEDNIFNAREYGKFCLDIPLNSKVYNIKKEDYTTDGMEGVYIIQFKLDKKITSNCPHHNKQLI